MIPQKSKWGVAGTLLGVIVLGAVASARAETVTVRSGNGTIGTNDTLVKMLVGPADSEFATTFTATDFTSARTGSAAFIIANNGAWISALSGDATSKWIATNANGAGEGGTALYAISFNLASSFSTATLDLNYAVDNQLGGSLNQGVFLNGTAISGNSVGGTFGSEFTLNRTDIAPLLNVGTNTLYINAIDQGGPAGLIFRATINTVGSAAPEPGALALTLLGGLPLAAVAVRRRLPRL